MHASVHFRNHCSLSVADRRQLPHAARRAAHPVRAWTRRLPITGNNIATGWPTTPLSPPTGRRHARCRRWPVSG